MDSQENWPEELVEFKRSQLTRGDRIHLGGVDYPIEEIIQVFSPMLTDERRARMNQVIERRSWNLVPVFENPYDLGNISAVMRSCEAFGFLQFDLVIPPGSRFKAANRVARGADKWLDVHIHRSPKECVQKLKDNGFKVYATHLEAAQPLAEIDMSGPTAIVLGNEKEGVSREMLDLVDGQVIIPMQGFTQSFNISVAAALVFYEARRQKKVGDLSDKQKTQVFANYLLRSFDNPERILKLMRQSRSKMSD